jgi:hypothetical protein
MPLDIHLCTVIGETTQMLPHYIEHYKSLGVNVFHPIVHLQSKNDPFYKNVTNVLDGYDIQIDEVHIGAWNGKIGTNLINSVLSKYPDEWIVVSDQDELQLYPHDLEKVIRDAECKNDQFITGCFLDRVSSDGGLREVDKNNIWQQFPNCGFLSFPLVGANPYKVTLCKGSMTLSEGQHGVVLPGEHYPVTNSVICQVHHFKWDKTVIPRLEGRLEQQSKGHWENSYEGYVDEVKGILNYFDINKNQIELANPLFLIEESKKDYFSYSHWNNVLNITKAWDSLQSYPRVAFQ